MFLYGDDDEDIDNAHHLLIVELTVIRSPFL